MEASFVAGKSQSAAMFDYRPDQGRVLFKAPRPDKGYTKVIHSFATDHPEFQVLAAKLQDPDSLKFNHQLHLTSVTLPAGKKLNCADCHKPDAAGVYYLKISYQENCKSCHPLQFDVDNPASFFRMVMLRMFATSFEASPSSTRISEQKTKGSPRAAISKTSCNSR